MGEGQRSVGERRKGVAAAHLLSLAGAGQDVGRSCILVSIGGKNVMLDCGMHMGFNDDVSPVDGLPRGFQGAEEGLSFGLLHVEGHETQSLRL